jgi:VIT1/CCC1 family predicted Fe2+/Mn2+ transporter
MLEQIKNSPIMSQGLFVAAFGLLGVFLVLVLFFFIIKGLQKIPFKD